VACPTPDTLVASDGGETLNRLFDAGFDREDPALDSIWREALRMYRLYEASGRVFLQMPLARAAHDLNRLSDALVALDGLRVIAMPPHHQARTLADQAEDYLRQVSTDDSRVHRRPEVRASSGLLLRPALAIDTLERGRIFVQPGSTSSKTQSFDHAYTTFHLFPDAQIAKENRLVILGGSLRSWNFSRLRILTDVAYVGFLSERARITRFLYGSIPTDPLMSGDSVAEPIFDPYQLQ